MELIPDHATRVISFSDFELDLRAGELCRNGARVKLQNQPFQVLALLLEHPGQVVTRDELRARLWPAETFVDFEHGLNSIVRRLREALGDSAETPMFIETVGRRGYRFVFPVDKIVSNNRNGNGAGLIVPNSLRVSEATLAPATVTASQRWLRPTLAAGLLIILAGSVWAIFERPFGGQVSQLLSSISGRTHSGSAVIQRQLTANPADMPVTSAALSPDGEYLAYTDKTGLYVRQIPTGETHPVNLAADFRVWVQSWFPDNTHLLVAEVRNDERPSGLWMISILGGSPRQIIQEGTGASVSPDGSTIAFLRRGMGRNELWLMQADGKAPERILSDASADQVYFSPAAWATDGKRLAYIRNVIPVYNAADPAGTKKSIEILDLSDRHVEVIKSGAEIEPAIAWSPDGALLYSLREPETGQSEFALWRIPIDEYTSQPSGKAIKVATGWGWAADMSIARRGRSLIMQRLEPNADAYIADIDSKSQRLSAKRITLDDRADYPFGWTLDSNSLLFLSDRDGPLHLFKQGLDQTQPELLVGGDDILGIPRMGPSGRDVFYLLMPKTRKGTDPVKIMKVPLAGGVPQMILEAPGIWNYQCAQRPAKTCLYSPTDPSVQRFFAFDPDTGVSQEIEFARVPTGPERPNWSLSPDGDRLGVRILRSDGDAVIRIWTLSNASTTTISLSGWPESAGIDWAADGKSLWIAAKHSRTPGLRDCALLQVRLDGQVKVRFEDENLCFLAGIPSPDGRRLALPITLPNSSNVWLLKNF